MSRPCVPEGLPFIVRMAGLSVEAIEAFVSADCSRPEAILNATGEQLKSVRAALAERLYEDINGADRATRRALLGLRRDCFNNRPLARWPKRPDWHRLGRDLRHEVETILALEARHEGDRQQLHEAYQTQLHNEERTLTALAERTDFVRGLSLSSLVLARSLPKLGGGNKLREKRRRRMMTGLLRYATRSALKLSPFSTLTTVGLGIADPQGTSKRLLDQDDWRSRSGVWLHRFLLDQWIDLLQQQPTFRAGLNVRLNDTIEETPNGRLRFLRPAQWHHAAPDDEALSLRKPALVRVRLTSPVVTALRARSWGESLPHHALVDQLATTFSDRDREGLAALVDQLLNIGFLLFDPPWFSNDMDLQRSLLSYLETLPADPALRPVTEQLRALVDVLEGFASTTTPARDVGACKRLVEDMHPLVFPLGGVSPSVAMFSEARDHYFAEDVFVASDDAARAQSVLTVPQADIVRLVDAVVPLARFAGALDHRNDYLLTLADAAMERFGNQNRVPFFAFFESTQPIYQDYIRFQMSTRGADAPRGLPCFNPRNRADIAEAQTARAAISKQVKQCIAPSDLGATLDHEKLTALLDKLPHAYGACRDFSAFLQPVDESSRSWVLNDLFEGAGRMTSRYSTAMNTEQQRAWSRALAQHATIGLQGQPVEVVDLFCPAGHGINVHAPQTRRTLVLPGETVSLPAERQLLLRDLWVDLRGAFPRLSDPEGRLIAPLHLGGVVVRYMPSLFKFLTYFGTTELIHRIPVGASRRLGDTRIVDRHTLAGVVYRRKSWTFERATVLPRFETLRGVALFEAVQVWRRAHQLPRQVFVQEPVEGGLQNPHRKPQFIDFTSPSLVELFRVVLLNDYPIYRLTEALPTTDQHPRSSDGGHRAFEIQIDTFGALDDKASPRRRNTALLHHLSTTDLSTSPSIRAFPR